MQPQCSPPAATPPTAPPRPIAPNSFSQTLWQLNLVSANGTIPTPISAIADGQRHRSTGPVPSGSVGEPERLAGAVGSPQILNLAPCRAAAAARPASPGGRWGGRSSWPASRSPGCRGGQGRSSGRGGSWAGTRTRPCGAYWSSQRRGRHRHHGRCPAGAGDVVPADIPVGAATARMEAPVGGVAGGDGRPGRRRCRRPSRPRGMTTKLMKSTRSPSTTRWNTITSASWGYRASPVGRGGHATTGTVACPASKGTMMIWWPAAARGLGGPDRAENAHTPNCPPDRHIP